MPKKYTKKRTSIGIEEDEISKINRFLRPKEKLSDFGRMAIINELDHREREKIAYLTSTDQFHKIENMKKDIEDLRNDVDGLDSELNEWKDVAIEMEAKFFDFAQQVAHYIDTKKPKDFKFPRRTKK